MADLEPGARLGHRYVVLARLGFGGMGTVYLARDERDERQVAVKVMRAKESGKARAARRFKREARAASALDPARVAEVYDVGQTEDGLAFLVMEYVRGTTLRARLQAGALDRAEALRLVREIATTLTLAHDAGLVHRDIKPDNVMIGEEGRVVLLDFGIAKEAEVGGDPGHLSTSITVEGTMLGTPAYVAPEQAMGHDVGPAADQFALAVTAFELLTGKLPWTATDPARLIAQVLGDRPRAASAVNDRLPRSLDAVLARAMSKERGDRFPSVGAFADALERAERQRAAISPVGQTLDDERVPAGGPASTSPTPGHPRSRATGAWVGGLVAAAAIIAGAAVWLGLRPMAPATSRAQPAAVPGAAHADPCTSSAACARAHDGAWRCNAARHACVEIASVDCEVHAEPGDLESDDTVWIGGMFPRTTEPGWDVEVRGAELARRDFAQALGSSGARSREVHARPIALVVCDEGANPLRAARHLAEDVEVPAVLGFYGTKTVLGAIPAVFLPARVLSFLSIAQAADFTRIPQPSGEPRLIWRSTLNHAAETEPLSALLSGVLEPRARSRPGGIGARPMRVAVVREEAALHDVSDDLFRGLHFNGKGALENGDDFRQFIFPASPDAGAGDVVGGLTEFAPEVVFVGVDAFVPRVLRPLEERWKRGARPYYVIGSNFEEVLDFIGTDPGRRRRFFAITNVATSPTNSALVLHYNRSFPAQSVTLTTAPQPSYDAFYVLAYATYGLGAGPVDGPALARGIDRLLPPGRKIDVGPAGIFAAFDALRAGERLDLVGAIGGLDFDPRTGEAPIDYAILCAGIDARGKASGSIESGLVYDAMTKRLRGSLTCP